MRYFQELQDIIVNYLQEHEVKLIQSAYLFAKNAHQGQFRKTGEPYIIHPVAAAVILAKMKLDCKTIVATILHDVLEDTNINKQTLIEEFDLDIANLVDGVSKLKQIKFSSQAEAQAENFRKMILAMVKDIRVILVKLGDRLHNMRTLYFLPIAKRKRIALETLEIYAPLANRLGIHKIYTELEDLCFMALYPMRYKIIKEASKEIALSHQEMLQIVKENISKLLLKAQVNNFTLYARYKHLYSLYNKMLKKRTSFKDIVDIYGFRIVVDNEDFCYRILGLIHSIYKPLAKRFKDYIAIPKSNGYQSLHTVVLGPFGVPIEFQIRTNKMHEVANMGIAAHWIYKDFDKKQNYDAVSLDWIKQIDAIQESVQSSLDFIESVKIALLPDEVYVFTPKGDIITLPSKSTPVDFAYYIHINLGNSCVGAKINRRVSPLNTKLTNGQTVEIISDENARPCDTWLNFVRTKKATTEIKKFINRQRDYDALFLGRRLLLQEFTNINLDVNQLDINTLQALLHQLNLNTVEDLYQEIGFGRQYPKIIINKLFNNECIVSKNDTVLFIRGTEGMVVTFAACCYPIPGDLVVGLLSHDNGLEIHRDHCKIIAEYVDAPEHIAVAWDRDTIGEFKVKIDLEVINQKRVLARLANIISNANSSIENINVDSNSSKGGKVSLLITVYDKKHLQHIIKKLQQSECVISYQRIIAT